MALFKLEKILVPLDGSDNSFRALDAAVFLAKTSGASITALYCVSIFPSIEVQTVDPIKCQVEERKFAESVLKKAESICKENNVKFYKITAYGSPRYMIVKGIRTNRVNLVVIGSRGRSTVKEIFLGSVSNYVLHKSPTPVLIVK